MTSIFWRNATAEQVRVWCRDRGIPTRELIGGRIKVLDLSLVPEAARSLFDVEGVFQGGGQ